MSEIPEGKLYPAPPRQAITRNLFLEYYSRSFLFLLSPSFLPFPLSFTRLEVAP